MIVGNGDIASVLVDRDDLLFFASGVSNSRETRETEYQREIQLLTSQPRDKRLVYFGSLSIFYADTRYTRHKLEMERIVKQLFPMYAIVRIGNITWGINPNTLINFLRDKFQKGEPLEIRDEYRYVVERDEFLHWIGVIPDFNCEINVGTKRMKVQGIVEKYVFSNKK
jgi:hypothetical protein